MAQAASQIDLTPEIQRALVGVRRRIRWYVLVEGLSLAIIWVAGMFWLALALDYLPVLVGASEMPAVARGILLAAVAGVLAFILYRWVLRRLVVPLHDHSMALLLERKHAALQDSLVTTVEMNEAPSHAAEFSPEMLAHTTAQAEEGIRGVKPSLIFNYAPLAGRAALAVVLAASIAGFAVAKSETVAQAAKRIYLLSDEPWERSARIEVVGIEVERAPAPGESTSRTVELPFENGVVKVAKGANVALKVRALLPPAAKAAPTTCTVYYRADRGTDGAGGERGSVLLGNSRDSGGYRHFRFDGKPFKGILASLAFDVLGYDHRVRDFRLEVVDSPAIISTRLDLAYPAYMVDEATSNYLPAKDQEYLPQGTFIPLGTGVTLRFEANKPLRRAEIYNVETKSLDVVEIAAAGKMHFDYPVGILAGNLALEVALLDADNVMTERPHKVFLTAVEDRPPLVEVRLRGIGTSVTPDVLVPFQGKISDDYALAKTWFDVQIGEMNEPRQIELSLGRGGTVEQQIDFRDQRSQGTGLEIKPADKLFLTVQAADKYNLSGGPHVGSGERYQLDVVTPDELLARLEVREIGLRRRFEQTLDELSQMRDSLLRVKSGLLSGADESIEPEEIDPDEPQLSEERAAEKAAELRLLRVQRAMQQSQKSAQETLGIAEGFAAIREELINNRVDTEERKLRLQEQIADPLRGIATTEFPQLDRLLSELETKLRQAPSMPVEAGPLTVAADDVLEQTNETIAQLEAVLKKMLDLETYNELVDLVRDLMRDQELLQNRTSQERKRQALEDLQ